MFPIPSFPQGSSLDFFLFCFPYQLRPFPLPLLNSCTALGGEAAGFCTVFGGESEASSPSSSFSSLNHLLPQHPPPLHSHHYHPHHCHHPPPLHHHCHHLPPSQPCYRLLVFIMSYECSYVDDCATSTNTGYVLKDLNHHKI